MNQGTAVSWPAASAPGLSGGGGLCASLRILRGPKAVERPKLAGVAARPASHSRLFRAFPMSLYHLVYQSQALVPLSAPELAELLKQARAHNRRLHVTGVLLHAPDGRFLQVLEGEEADVRQLYYQHIRSDPRHYRCQVLGEGSCVRRSFAKWDMGSHITDVEDLNALLQGSGFTTPAHPGFRPTIYPELLKLLLDFAGPRAAQ